MNTTEVRHASWTRMFVADSDQIREAKQQYEAPHEALTHRAPSRRGSASVTLHLISDQGGAAQVHEITLHLGEDHLTTIEPAGGVPACAEAEQSFGAQLRQPIAPAQLCVAVVQAGYAAVARSLTRIEADLNEVHRLAATLDRAITASRAPGVSDLPQMSRMLDGINRTLGYAADSIERLTRLLRLARQRLPQAARGTVDGGSLAEVIQQGQVLVRRLEFVADRHRFFSQGIAQKIAASDLNVVKVFTVLWAILIPGTTLINWYGQNFEFMPELSWSYGPWVLIAGVFVLAALPIYVIKRAGQLR